LVNLELVQLACSLVEQLERVDIVNVKKKLYHTVTNITVTVYHINNVPYEILCLLTAAIITQATTKQARACVLTENTQ